MQGEFEKQIRKITDNKTSEKLVEMINLAGQDFPCLTCPSNAECGSFKWFIKWFGKTDLKP
jgi:hypothetical protein